jgi:WD40 repeat protein
VSEGGAKESRFHSGPVGALAFSRDGKVLASGSADRSIALSRNGEVIHRLAGHKGPILALAFAPDQALLSASRERIRIWNSRDGSLIRNVLANRENFAETAALASRSQRIAVDSGDAEVKVFDLRSGDRIANLPIKAAGGKQIVQLLVKNSDLFVTALAFSPMDELLALGTNLGGIFLYGSDLKKPFWAKAIFNSPVTALAFSNNQEYLSAGTYDSSAVTLSLKREATEKPVQLRSGPVIQIAFAPDDSFFARAFDGDTVRIYRTSDGAEIRDMGVGGCSVAFAPDGRTLAVGSADGSVHTFATSAKL